jgi:hypothetical protein
MNCPHCQYDLKMNTLIDIAREILAKVSHCPNNGIKEVFDREFHREPKPDHHDYATGETIGDAT